MRLKDFKRSVHRILPTSNQRFFYGQQCFALSYRTMASPKITSATHTLLHTALMAEARPLINYYKLQSLSDQVFRTWSNGLITLVVSGMGKVKAASATAVTLNSLPRNSICLNIGIAGSDQPIGQLLRAHCIVDAATKQRWYPQLTATSDIPTTSVCTVDQPAIEYDKLTSFDMEAAGFYQAALMYGTSELTQSIKVISDNPSMPILSDGSKLDANFVSDLIEAQLEPVEHFINELSGLAANLPAGENLDSLFQAWCTQYRFTVTEQRQLKRQLQRYWSLFHQLPDEDLARKQGKPAVLIKYLEQQLTKQSICY